MTACQPYNLRRDLCPEIAVMSPSSSESLEISLNSLFLGGVSGLRFPCDTEEIFECERVSKEKAVALKGGSRRDVC